MVKTFEEYLLEAYLRAPTSSDIGILNKLKSDGYDYIESKTQVDPRTGDIYFTTKRGLRYVYHANDKHVQELYAVKNAA